MIQQLTSKCIKLQPIKLVRLHFMDLECGLQMLVAVGFRCVLRDEFVNTLMVFC